MNCTAQIRNESYRKVTSDKAALSNAQQKVFEQVSSSGQTLQEISEIIGMKEHLVCARLSELRKAGFVFTDGSKKFNQLTRKNNSLWKLSKHQLELF